MLPENEIRGVTVVLITCSYNQAEFIRIGYYLNNDYRDPALCVVATAPAHPNIAMNSRFRRRRRQNINARCTCTNGRWILEGAAG